MPSMAPDVPRLLAALHRLYDGADCALRHRNAFELLVATILSAQCTDERVNKVTPALFRRYPTPAKMARAPLNDLEELIRSTGFFRQKAKSLSVTAQRLATDHRGEVPRTLEALLALRGVARKTANVVLGNAYGIASGVVVDTHVGRLSRRLGLTRHTDPVKIEKDLTKKIPTADWIWFSHALITHGRALCLARRPRCGDCPLRALCPSAGNV
ncbi:MAG: endonuclease III [Elusimicrobia bacterium]|jgi:endonuclease-3|nr:endonuclease III [Elusimicrobiota bacterium]MBK7208628.1 endonuclease III [Elusimicrobiota bacterium]MBK7545372.1 endonuclease III [Elusimicrobiota bacterium]MBK7575611.1 endonuclease III [Elusimicrobiota bacterium]MBK8127058.1 endonuclease III [Elusimicrobiota bacterium]